MDYLAPVDIANRACQHLGVSRIFSLFPPDQSKQAVEMAFSYDKVRQAELRRNLWVFATRKVAMRALDTTSQLLTFEAWSSAYTYVDGSTGYPAGYIVRDSAGFLWVSLAGANTSSPGAPTPGFAAKWDSYFGNLIANAWNDSVQNSSSTTNNTSYHLGEISYLLTDGTIYVSIVEGNQNNPEVVDTWSGTTLYPAGAVVAYNGVNYQGLVGLNFGHEPDTNPGFWTTTITNPLVSGSWIQLTGASAGANPIVFPLTSGPSRDTTTRNAFRLPQGHMRPAPQAPKAGATSWAGAHTGLPANDDEYDGQYIVAGPDRTEMLYRFIADVQDVSTFDPMFCEGLAGRIAKDLAPQLAAEMLNQCVAAYNQAMSEARTVDAIEAGPVQEEEDSYITCRY